LSDGRARGDGTGGSRQRPLPARARESRGERRRRPAAEGGRVPGQVLESVRRRRARFPRRGDRAARDPAADRQGAPPASSQAPEAAAQEARQPAALASIALIIRLFAGIRVLRERMDRLDRALLEEHPGAARLHLLGRTLPGAPERDRGAARDAHELFLRRLARGFGIDGLVLDRLVRAVERAQEIAIRSELAAPLLQDRRVLELLFGEVGAVAGQGVRQAELLVDPLAGVLRQRLTVLVQQRAVLAEPKTLVLDRRFDARGILRGAEIALLVARRRLRLP